MLRVECVEFIAVQPKCCLGVYLLLEVWVGPNSRLGQIMSCCFFNLSEPKHLHLEEYMLDDS